MVRGLGQAEIAAGCALLTAGLVAVPLGGCAERTDRPRQLAGADAAKGLKVIERVGCGACHVIPGVDWPQGRVGGPLDGFGTRPLIAGSLPNQPDVLVRWIVDAPSLAPATAMPPQPLTQDQARDVAAYLYTLDAD